MWLLFSVVNQNQIAFEEYLSDFLVEYKQITENGFAWDDKIYFVKIKALVCDAPARQFVKCIKGHSGYYSCERCEIQGNWEQGMYFVETDSTIREVNFHHLNMKITKFRDLH